MRRAALCVGIAVACHAKSAPDAGVSAPSASASASAVAPASAPEVDLLWATDAKVAVSSRVANATDKPEHLVDHKPETAWNSKTGDLVGAWIQFRVPADASVHAIAITVGFDKKTDKEDLFTENYRVAKVRVSHAGKTRDFDLDPNVRAPQRVDVGTGGGDYKIEVRAVVRGTKRAWRELTVSELAVMGTAPHTHAPSAPPVLVGGLDVTVVDDYATTDDATWDAACDKLTAADDADAKKFGGGDEAAAATCSAPTTKSPGKGAILETAHVPFTSAGASMGRGRFDGDLFAMRTATGVVITDIHVSGVQSTMNPSTQYTVLKEGWSGDDYVLDVQSKTTTWEDGYIPPDPEDGAVVDHGPWYDVGVTHAVCSSKTATCKLTYTKKEGRF